MRYGLTGPVLHAKSRGTGGPHSLPKSTNTKRSALRDRARAKLAMSRGWVVNLSKLVVPEEVYALLVFLTGIQATKTLTD